jgi:hypothetical protein
MRLVPSVVDGYSCGLRTQPRHFTEPESWSPCSRKYATTMHPGWEWYTPSLTLIISTTTSLTYFLRSGNFRSHYFLALTTGEEQDPIRSDPPTSCTHSWLPLPCRILCAVPYLSITGPKGFKRTRSRVVYLCFCCPCVCMPPDGPIPRPRRPTKMSYNKISKPGKPWGLEPHWFVVPYT